MAILANPRTETGVMAFGKNVVAWEALRIEIDNRMHWFAMQYYTQADKAELEQWLTVISETTGLPAQHERAN